jgi:hypothetical protein
MFYPDKPFTLKEYKVHVTFVSGGKDVPQNFFAGQNIRMSACVLQWSPGAI